MRGLQTREGCKCSPAIKGLQPRGNCMCEKAATARGAVHASCGGARLSVALGAVVKKDAAGWTRPQR